MRTLIALHTHPYEGRRREAGSEYDATDSDAFVLVTIGQARYKDEQPAPVNVIDRLKKKIRARRGAA